MINSTPRTWNVGETVTKAMLDAEVRDALTGAQSAWTAWTPALTATTNPVLGEGGSATGRYTRIGKTVLCSGRIKFGTTGQSFGTGTIAVSLPVAANITSGTFGCIHLSPNGSVWVAGWFVFATSTTANILVPETPTTDVLTVLDSETMPGWTELAPSSEWRFNVVYEAS